MKLTRLAMAGAVVGAMILLTGCVPGDGACTPEHPGGFLSGVWHGWIAPLSLVLSLFQENVRIYETANTGWWYDFGYYIAVVGGFGGLSLTRRRKSKHEPMRRRYEEQ